MIYKPNFSYFKNGEVVQFTDNALSILKANDPTALKVKHQYDHLEERFQTLKTLYILDQGNEITEEIKDYDSRRDDALIGINLNVDSYQKHFEEEKRQAGARLRALLDKYGRDLYKRSYPEETAGIRNMKEEIDGSPELTVAVDTLYLTAWFGELGRLNDRFDVKYLERNKAYAEAPKEKFADVRVETEAAFDELAKHLTAHSVISPGKAYNQVINELDQLVLSYNRAVEKRIGSSGGDEGATGDSPFTE